MEDIAPGFGYIALILLLLPLLSGMLRWHDVHKRAMHPEALDAREEKVRESGRLLPLAQVHD